MTNSCFAGSTDSPAPGPNYRTLPLSLESRQSNSGNVGLIKTIKTKHPFLMKTSPFAAESEPAFAESTTASSASPPTEGRCHVDDLAVILQFLPLFYDNSFGCIATVMLFFLPVLDLATDEWTDLGRTAPVPPNFASLLFVKGNRLYRFRGSDLSKQHLDVVS